MNTHTQLPNDNAADWLQEKINLYQAEVTRLEAELKHAQILLRGHLIWLEEVKRKEGKNGNN
jgi:hypothetical protein